MQAVMAILYAVVQLLGGRKILWFKKY
jgi:hypothetical protein